jgi:hypothetical protein
MNESYRTSQWCVDERRDAVSNADGQQYAGRVDQKTIPGLDLNCARRDLVGAKQLGSMDLRRSNNGAEVRPSPRFERALCCPSVCSSTPEIQFTRGYAGKKRMSAPAQLESR